MKQLFIALAGCLVLLSACESSSVRDRKSANIGGYEVTWSKGPTLDGYNYSGKTPLAFVIMSSCPGKAGSCERSPASHEQKIKLASQALATDPRCTWAGFDPAYNSRLAYLAGGEKYMLFVLANCR